MSSRWTFASLPEKVFKKKNAVTQNIFICNCVVISNNSRGCRRKMSFNYLLSVVWFATTNSPRDSLPKGIDEAMRTNQNIKRPWRKSGRDCLTPARHKSMSRLDNLPFRQPYLSTSKHHSKETEVIRPTAPKSAPQALKKNRQRNRQQQLPTLTKSPSLRPSPLTRQTATLTIYSLIYYISNKTLLIT